MPRWTIWGGFAVVALAGAIFTALWVSDDGQTDGMAIVDAGNTELVALGRQIYARECASCHGVNLEGQANWRQRRPDGRMPAPPHDETGHTWHHPDGQLFAVTRDGVAAYAPPGYATDMPGFGDRLSDREIAAALAWIKSQWPADIRARQAEITRQSQQRDPS